MASDSSQPEFWDTRYRDRVTPWGAGRVLVPGCGSGYEVRVRQADFFTLEAPRFELVHPGGMLAGFFYFGEAERGPPFAITGRELHALLDPAFMLLEDEAVRAAQSVPILAGKERWQVWKRRP